GDDIVYADIDYEKYSQKVVLDTFMVGLVAPSLIVHRLLPLFRSESNIITISGTFSDGAKGWLPYYVSKRALEDLTVGLAQELQEKGIRVNGISPSDTATEAYKKYFPQYLPCAVSPETIAKQALLLCLDEAKKGTGEVWIVKKGKKPVIEFHS